MIDLYKAVTGSVGRFVQSWLVPAVLGVGLFVLFLLPVVDDKGLFAQIRELGDVGQVVSATTAALVLAFILAVIATPGYRFLEGYHWFPRREKRIRKHRKVRAELLDRVEHQTRGVELSKTRDRLDRYPRHSRNIMPTRLGNLLRGAETYGSDQYGLDTAILWSQLSAVTEDKALNAAADARATMDFFMGLLLLAPTFSVAAVFAAVYGGEAKALFGLIALPLAFLLYQAVVHAGIEYAASLRAIADVGRIPLAEQLGFTMPDNLDDERELWKAVTGYAAWGPHFSSSRQWIDTMNKHRRQPTTKAPD